MDEVLRGNKQCGLQEEENEAVVKKKNWKQFSMAQYERHMKRRRNWIQNVKQDAKKGKDGETHWGKYAEE